MRYLHRTIHNPSCSASINCTGCCCFEIRAGGRRRRCTRFAHDLPKQQQLQLQLDRGGHHSWARSSRAQQPEGSCKNVKHCAIAAGAAMEGGGGTCHLGYAAGFDPRISPIGERTKGILTARRRTSLSVTAAQPCMDKQHRCRRFSRTAHMAASVTLLT